MQLEQRQQQQLYPSSQKHLIGSNKSFEITVREYDEALDPKSKYYNDKDVAALLANVFNKIMDQPKMSSVNLKKNFYYFVDKIQKVITDNESAAIILDIKFVDHVMKYFAPSRVVAPILNVLGPLFEKSKTGTIFLGKNRFCFEVKDFVKPKDKKLSQTPIIIAYYTPAEKIITLNNIEEIDDEENDQISGEDVYLNSASANESDENLLNTEAMNGYLLENDDDDGIEQNTQQI